MYMYVIKLSSLFNILIFDSPNNFAAVLPSPSVDFMYV